MLRRQRPFEMLRALLGLCFALTSWRPVDATPPGLPDGQLQAVPGCNCKAKKCCPDHQHKSDVFSHAFDPNDANFSVGTAVGQEVWMPACSLMNIFHGPRNVHTGPNGFLSDLCGETRLRKHRHTDICSYLEEEDNHAYVEWTGSKAPKVGLIVETGSCEGRSIGGANCWNTEPNQTWMAQWISMGRTVEEKGPCPSSTYFNTTFGQALGVGMHCHKNETSEGMRVTMKWMHPADESMRTTAACNLKGDFDEVIAREHWWGSYMEGPKFICLDVPKSSSDVEYHALIYALGDAPCTEMIPTTTSEATPEEEYTGAVEDDPNWDHTPDGELIVDGMPLHDYIMQATLGLDPVNVTPTVHVQTPSNNKSVNTTAAAAQNQTNSSKSNTSSAPKRWQQIYQKKQEERQQQALQAQLRQR